MTERHLSSKLGIKPGSTVSLIRPNPETLSQIRQGSNINTFIDRIEKDSDVILYWYDPTEDIREKMLELQSQIRPNGRIWVIIPKKEVAKKQHLDIDWNQMQGEILKTHLVDNKVASINGEEYGTQFVIRKGFRDTVK
ncbi:MAG: DUF3052 family protein [Chloroflexi bacterium]|nr:DUF3052 family protein [Chloroflexota bacterium]